MRFEGYRRVAIAGVSDPLILQQMDVWMEKVKQDSFDKIRLGMGLEPEKDYRYRTI